jgi:D-alanyl-D-alanine carboxypeptidase
VRRVTGRAYGKEVDRRILRPLRLRSTEVPGTDVTIDGPHAHGYEPIERNGEIVPLDFTHLNPSMVYSAGEIVSTTADLNLFYRSLLSGRLLRRTQLAEMLANPVGELSYGLGITSSRCPAARRCGGTPAASSGTSVIRSPHRTPRPSSPARSTRGSGTSGRPCSTWC